MSRKLKYKIISCSSEQSEHPVSSLLFNGSNGGWQTKRFCTYPQQITFEFYGIVQIDKIQLISNGKKIPSQVDILYFLPFKQQQQSEERFQKYGYLNFNRNDSNNMVKEQKSIMVDVKCLYLRFLFHKPHHSKENFFSQIGIEQISIFGTDTKSNFAVVDKVEKIPRQIGQTGDGTDRQNQDPFIYEKVSYLNSLKERAVANEDFQSANGYKSMIEEIKKMEKQLNKLHNEKQKAIEEEDYQRANDFKNSINEHKKQIEEMLEDEDGIMEGQEGFGEGQNQNNGDNDNQMNDFQDNEFVDPEMNEIIKKSNQNFHKESHNNSSLMRSNKGKSSRVKLNNRSGHFGKQKTEVRENYDEKVIPTLVHGNNSKVKTQESQAFGGEGEQEKKVEYEPQEIDGKYIQFSIIMQQFFEEDTVKSFFSKHWQLKVAALSKIQQETNKRPNPDANYIKCLLVVVKNSINETNFQVALNSLNLLESLLKINAKGNILSRNNEMVNDLDLIIREVLKKMTDNNHKIKQSADRVFEEIVNSSLYGPQVCMVALSKQKGIVKKVIVNGKVEQKENIPTKVLIMRLNEQQKIVEKHGKENTHIVAMAADCGVQYSTNPSLEVRNEAISLLAQCQNVNPNEFDKRLKDHPNLGGLIEAHKEKGSKIEKPKRKR